MLMQTHKEMIAAAPAVKEDVYVVGRSYNGQLTLQVATQLQPEVSGLRKMFNQLVGPTEVPSPSVGFEVPDQKGCFYVILDSECEECCLLSASLASCINACHTTLPFYSMIW